MTKRGPVDGDWKRLSRLGVLFIAGGAGLLSQWMFVPRWAIGLVALAVPVVWIATGFEAAKAGESEARQRQRMRNIAIGLALAALVLLFYVATMARLGGNALTRPM